MRSLQRQAILGGLLWAVAAVTIGGFALVFISTQSPTAGSTNSCRIGIFRCLSLLPTRSRQIRSLSF